MVFFMSTLLMDVQTNYIKKNSHKGQFFESEIYT